MKAFNDNADISGGGPFRPSAWAAMLPSLVVALGYGGLVGVLALQDRLDTSLARLSMIVLAIAVPFLLAHAVLRLATVRVAMLPHAVHLHPGFPRSRAYEVPYGLVTATRIRRGLGGRITGSGTLVLVLADGHSVAAADLADPQAARAAILERQGRAPGPASATVEALRQRAAGGRGR